MSGIGLRLREERARLGLTQKEFGAIGGVAANAQGKYESGARTPSAHYLAAVSASGVDILYVVTGIKLPIHAGGLSQAEENVLGTYRTLPTQGQEALRQVAVTMAEMAANYSPSVTVKTKPSRKA